MPNGWNKKKEILVVGSKVKAYVRSRKCMVSGDLVGALSFGVYDMLDKAIGRTKANKRSTVSSKDL